MIKEGSGVMEEKLKTIAVIKLKVYQNPHTYDHNQETKLHVPKSGLSCGSALRCVSEQAACPCLWMPNRHVVIPISYSRGVLFPRFYWYSLSYFPLNEDHSLGVPGFYEKMPYERVKVERSIWLSSSDRLNRSLLLVDGKRPRALHIMVLK